MNRYQKQAIAIGAVALGISALASSASALKTPAESEQSWSVVVQSPTTPPPVYPTRVRTIPCVDGPNPGWCAAYAKAKAQIEGAPAPSPVKQWTVVHPRPTR